MKLTRAYATLEIGGALPPVRYLAAAIGPEGRIFGHSAAKAQPSVMSRATALAVLR